jgi:hypothetical protein
MGALGGDLGADLAADVATVFAADLTGALLGALAALTGLAAGFAGALAVLLGAALDAVLAAGFGAGLAAFTGVLPVAGLDGVGLDGALPAFLAGAGLAAAGCSTCALLDRRVDCFLITSCLHLVPTVDAGRAIVVTSRIAPGLGETRLAAGRCQ